MERMTFKTNSDCGPVWVNRIGVTPQMSTDRLAAYEDTGLEPEEVVDLQRAWDMYGGEEGITAMLTPPPNAPLTLEELQGMDGEPVWVIQPDNILPPFWGVVDAKGGTVVGVLYCGTFEDYDTEWLAYRRKLEEGTRTAIQPPTPAWAEHFKARFERMEGMA